MSTAMGSRTHAVSPCDLRGHRRDRAGGRQHARGSGAEGSCGRRLALPSREGTRPAAPDTHRLRSRRRGARHSRRSLRSGVHGGGRGLLRPSSDDDEERRTQTATAQGPNGKSETDPPPLALRRSGFRAARHLAPPGITRLLAFRAVNARYSPPTPTQRCMHPAPSTTASASPAAAATPRRACSRRTPAHSSRRSESCSCS